MILVYLAAILLFCWLLIRSADIAVSAIKGISNNSQTSNFVVSALIIALGTSFPELFVGITSALERSTNLSLGVVLGSNIANIALIGSSAAVYSGRIHVYGGFLKRDIWMAFAAGVLPIILATDGSLSQVD